jgi:enediyne biosynthesis protein E4
MADFNLDGLVDLVVVNRWEAAQLWRNTTPGAGNWLHLRLAQPGANRDAIGAWIELRLGDSVLRREITAGGGHASGELGWRHLGLGAAAEAEVRVLWPDGTEGAWETLQGNAFYTLRPDAPAEGWLPQ